MAIMDATTQATTQDLLNQLRRRRGARPRDARPVLMLIHSLPSGTAREQMSAGSVGDLQDCRSSEDVLDVRIDGLSIMESGAGLPDPSRVLDMFLIHRLVSTAWWNVPISVERLTRTILDPSIFTFAEALERRLKKGEVTRAMITNSKKRVDQIFRAAGVENAISSDRSLGYLFNLATFEIQVVHIPH